MERMRLVRSLVRLSCSCPTPAPPPRTPIRTGPCMQRKVPQLVAGVSLIERERHEAKELIPELGSCVLFLGFGCLRTQRFICPFVR